MTGQIKIKTPEEIAIMREAGKLTSQLMSRLICMVKPGLATSELDDAALRIGEELGLKSGTLGYKGYPGAVCVSINEQLVHGIPSKDVVIRDGDVVKVDYVGVYKGFFLDQAATLKVGEVSASDESLIKVAYLATIKAIEKAKPGNHIGDISAMMQQIVELAGFNVTMQMTGHGIGTRMHEAPEIRCYGTPGTGELIKPGMVFAIETMAMVGGSELEIASDGWTASTIDGSTAAHWEHTVAVTESGPEILTSGFDKEID